MDNEEEREKERIGRKLKALDRESGRLIDAYQAEVIDLSELKERRERIEEHGRMLKRRLSEIHEKRVDREQQIRLLEGLEQFSESVRDSLQEPSFETRQQVLRLVVDRIVVENDKVVIHHVVPTGPVRLQTRHQAATGGNPNRFSVTPGSVGALISFLKRPKDDPVHMLSRSSRRRR